MAIPILRPRRPPKVAVAGLLVLSVASALSLPANARGGPAGDAGKAGLSFLKVRTDARGVAMGGAQVGSASGVRAIVWNPAGILNGQRTGNASAPLEAAFTHHESFQGVSHDFLGIALQRGAVAYAFGIFLSAVGDIELRDERPTAEPLAYFGASFVASEFAVALRTRNNVQVGIGVKYLYEKIFHYSASGFAVDLGAQIPTPVETIVAGVVVQHLGRMGTLRSAATSLPTNVRVGLEARTAAPSAVWGVEIGTYRFGDMFASIGTEVNVAPRTYLRAGYRLGSDLNAFNAGAGVEIARYAFGYAYAPYGRELGETHQMSLVVRL